jgi:PAS domain S-box-containing protein
MEAIGQSSDGFLWFVSRDLYRFDGVQFVRWNVPSGGGPAGTAALELGELMNAVSDHAGGLWVVGLEGIVHLKSTVIASRFELPGLQTTQTSSDPDGSLWVVRSANVVTDAPVCHVTDTAVRCFGKADGIPISPIDSLLPDGKGGFWLGGQTALVHWHDGVSETYPNAALKSNEGLPGISALARGPDGSLWLGILAAGCGGGLERFPNSMFRPFVAPGFDGSKLRVRTVMFDRDGNLWVGTLGKGIFRIHGTVVDHYGRSEGLSSDIASAIFEDREGIVWIATPNGIDSFRDPRVASFSTSEGLANDVPFGVLAARDGSIWVANIGSLDHIEKSGAVSSIRPADALPGNRVTTMLEDHAGNLWLGIDNGLFLFDHGRFRRLTGPNNQQVGYVAGMTEDMEGNIWAECGGKTRKLVRIRDFKVREEFPESQIPRGRTLAANPQGGIWIGTVKGDLALFRHGVLKEFPLHATGDPVIHQIIANSDGSVLANSADGLVGLRQDKVQRLTTKNGLPCNFVISFIEDREKRWWLYTDCGIVELPDSELKRWWANPEVVVDIRVYDVWDGARAGRPAYNSAAYSSDGRVWFASGDVVQMLDPSKLSRKALAALTYIESVTVNRKELRPTDNLKLSPHPRDLQIDYTSPTFLIPEKVKFRYRLDGYDRDWHDAGTRRQAFYTDLPPGKYSFRVIACNSDGVWNETPAKLDFTVAPAYYQTNWFRALCAAVILGLLWTAYQFRIGQLEAQEQKFREAVETMPALAFVARADGYRTFVNHGWVDYTGMTVEQAIGAGWQTAVYPDDLKRVDEKWRKAAATGKPLEYDLRLRRGTDGAYRWFQTRVAPLRDKRGKLVKWCGVANDIEDRKRAEQLQADLAHTNRISLLGELAASIAHEIKQPITGAMANARASLRWLKRDYPDLKEACEAIGKIERDGARANEIIDRLRALYKKTPPQRSPLDVNDVITEMVVLLRGEAHRHAVSIRSELATDVPKITGDRVQVQQVLMNLILNAIEAMHETGGVLMLKSERYNNGHVLISASDTGVGLPADKADQIFNAFFTTKPQGSGMGLAISRSIVESHGGRLWACPNDGRGATFKFTLPVDPNAQG